MARWQLGKPGTTLSVEAHLMTGAGRTLSGLCGVICLVLSAGALATGATEPYALGSVFALAGLLALAAALRPAQRLLLTGDALVVPSWIVGVRPRALALSTVQDVLHVPAPYSDGLSQLFARGNVRVSALVPRSQAAELADRIRLRAHARRIDAPDAIVLLETYFAPGRKPLGVIRHDDRWVAFNDIGELPLDEKPTYRTASKSIPVVMGPREFSLLERACPHLSFQLLAVSRIQ